MSRDGGFFCGKSDGAGVREVLILAGDLMSITGEVSKRVSGVIYSKILFFHPFSC